jgi:hypothetical protein
VGKPEEKIQLGRPWRRWEDEIRIDLREIGWERGVEWIQLAQDRGRWRAVVNKAMNLRVLEPRSLFTLSGQYMTRQTELISDKQTSALLDHIS